MLHYHSAIKQSRRVRIWSNKLNRRIIFIKNYRESSAKTNQLSSLMLFYCSLIFGNEWKMVFQYIDKLSTQAKIWIYL